MKMHLRIIVSATLLYIAGILILPGCNRTPSTDKPGSNHGAQKAASTTKSASGNKTIQAVSDKEPIENITSFDHLNSIIDGSPGKLLVFDMYADWCKPCRMLAPTYAALAQTHKQNARFFRVDVSQHQDIASAFRVNGIPNVVFIKDKEVVQAITGLNPREYYERILTACGQSVSAADCKARLADGL